MNLQRINALAGLRAALVAPKARRLDLFRERVMEPLRPFWAPFLARMPGGAVPDGADPVLHAARTFGFYSPALDVAAGLAALDQFERAGTWPACVAALERAWEALAPPAHGVGLDRVLFTLVLADPRVMPPRSGGYTGVGSMPGMVMVLAWPSADNLPRLPAAVAHEFNHNVRFSVEPFIPHEVTVGQYMVAEGLAEAFAAELFGVDKRGPWSDALSAEQLAATTPRFRDALEVRGFDEVRGYIFGDWSAAQFGHQAHGLPDFAGYTIGYRVVRAYLERTGTTAAAATYLPWHEIVDGSQFFHGDRRSTPT